MSPFERGVLLGLMLARGEQISTQTIREKFDVSKAQAKRDLLMLETTAYACAFTVVKEVGEQRQVVLKVPLNVRTEATTSARGTGPHVPPQAHGFALIELLLVAAILGILAAVLVPAWKGRNDRTEVLHAKDWQCMKTEERSFVYPVMAGKVAMMMPGLRHECVEWKRRPE